MRISNIALAIGIAVCAAPAVAKAPAFHLIPGAVPADKGPDGNTIILDAPKGLIVIDTGRHIEHTQAILDYAKSRGRPIAAIVNSHWHLDHTSGNAMILAAYPRAEIIASRAVDGVLFRDFMAASRKGAEEYLASGKATAAEQDEIRRGVATMNMLGPLHPTVPIVRNTAMRIAGRKLDVHLAPFAATEGDVWIYDTASRTAIVGDLVVGIVPFMDTACADGWANALDAIAKVPFTTLIPGHGDPMTRGDFLQWKLAYTNLVDCARSKADKKQCVAGWQNDAARFIDPSHKAYVNAAAAYYIDTRLRASAEQQQKYCKPPKA